MRITGGAPARVATRLATRRNLQHHSSNILHLFPFLSLLTAHILFFCLLPLPLHPIRTKTYVDENALQPAQANLHWGWDQVTKADSIAHQVANLALTSSANSASRAEALRALFASHGLPSFTQSYTYPTPPTLFRPSSSKLSGTNTYAIFRSPRTDGREAILITASWKSRWNGFHDPDLELPWTVAANLAATGLKDGGKTGKEGAETAYERLRLRKKVNVRGVASVIALSEYLSQSLHHSKDIIFVISDGHLDGMQAWASTYFNDNDPTTSSAQIDELHPSVLGRRIWTSISLDYPSDSFSHLAILHEGTNGGTPNMDVLNTVVRVAQNLPGSASIPIVLHGILDGSLDGRYGNAPDNTRFQASLLRSILPSFVCGLLEKYVWNGEDGSASFVLASKALLTQFRLMASGHPSGPHGLLHKYRIDSFTLYAVPSLGPYGFLHIGRVVESTLRSFSNLVERLHHSQFFYLLADVWWFIQLPVYILIPVLLGVGLSTLGLRAWAREGKLAQGGREKVGEVFEEWLDSQESAVVSALPLEHDDDEEEYGREEEDVGNASFAEVEGMLATSTTASLRKRLAPRSTKKTTAPRRSERIRASMSPEPSSSFPAQSEVDNEEEESDDFLPVERRQMVKKKRILDIPLESPTASQIESQLTHRAQQVFAALTHSGKLARNGQLEGFVEMVRLGMEAQDRPVVGALGLMGCAHLGAGVGVLGLVGKLDQCSVSGLWACGTYRLLNIFSLSYPLLLILLGSILTANPTTTTIPSRPESDLTLPKINQRARLGRLLHSFTLLYAGMLIAVLSVLNWALATSTGLLLALPLCYSSLNLNNNSRSGAGTHSPSLLIPQALVFLVLLNPSTALLVLSKTGWVEASALEAGLESVWIGWRVWGNGTLGFVGGVYQAVVWQAVVGIGLVLSSSSSSGLQ
ncbi:hypothetical protein A4X09_0g4231 [Tilletia walkeri]|uniref:Uncharacterized protein n=1 Tax=Tilletia walkeri TaxID=117179 RepID=A0A8X7N6J6_9BASI|nr:hypothetical protein A4X09_0g4231 [Tilletia walkeri]